MRRASGEIARLIELALQKFRLPASRIDDQIAGTQIAPATGSTSGAVTLSDANPVDVGDSGSADPGTDSAVSRSDHVHALPASGVTPDTYGDSTHIPVITVDAEGRITVASEAAVSAGTVTSVGLSMPSAVFDVSGSPVTGSGTITVTFDNQTANTVLAGPSTGAAATPAFRALVAADIPALNASTAFTSGAVPAERGGTGLSNPSGRSLEFNESAQIMGGEAISLNTFAIVAPASGTMVLGGGSLASARVPYATNTGTLTSEAGFEYVAASDELRVPLLRLAEQSTPSTPASGFGLLFFSTAGIPSAVDDGGIVRQMVRHVENTTFTPAFAGSSTAGTFTYSQQRGHYTRVENLCFFRIYLEVSAVSVAPTGDLNITGLPFTSQTT